MGRVLHFKGEVIDRQTLLDGTRELSIDADGASDGGEGWRLTLTFRWPKEAGDALDEGDLSVTDADGSSLFGALREGSGEDVFDEDTAEERTRFALAFEIRSGDGAFDGYGGRAQVDAELAGERATLTVRIDAEGAPAARRGSVR